MTCIDTATFRPLHELDELHGRTPKPWIVRNFARPGSACPGGARNDLRSCEEVLCRASGGALFLHGCGGALTRYAQSVGDGWTSGGKIIPLSEDEALSWLEEHGESAAIEAYFSHRIRAA